MAQEVEGALNAASNMDDAERQAQANIDKVVDETREITRLYTGVMKEIDGLEVYNALLDKQIASQNQEITDIANSIDQVSVIERQVTPLMLRMVESLDQFVELDVPFLLEERRQRVAFLRTLLERSDVTVAEKFRRVLEAYEIENDFGRTIEAYKGNLDLEGATREVDFLRVGRTALLYQSVDGEIYGMWNQTQREWAPLSAEYRNQIRTGIKIARKQIAPNLLLLPITAPEAAE
jgi:hypothetical protein